MGKLILFFSIITLTFTSHNSFNATQQDQFVGKWKITKIYQNGTELNLGKCFYESTITVSKNGTFANTTFAADSDSGCKFDKVESGTWKNNGDGSYETNTAGLIEVMKIAFEGNTLKTEQSFDGTTLSAVFVKQ